MVRNDDSKLALSGSNVFRLPNLSAQSFAQTLHRQPKAFQTHPKAAPDPGPGEVPLLGAASPRFPGLVSRRTAPEVQLLRRSPAGGPWYSVRIRARMRTCTRVHKGGRAGA